MDLVPDTFVDAFGEISFKHGLIRIELVSLSGPERRITQRLITSLPAFRQMLQAQNGMLEQLEKAGVIRPAQFSSEPSAAGPASEPSSVVGMEPRLALVEVPQAESSAQTTADVGARVAAGPAPPRSPNFSAG